MAVEKILETQKVEFPGWPDRDEEDEVGITSGCKVTVLTSQRFDQEENDENSFIRTHLENVIMDINSFYVRLNAAKLEIRLEGDLSLRKALHFSKSSEVILRSSFKKAQRSTLIRKASKVFGDGTPGNEMPTPTNNSKTDIFKKDESGIMWLEKEKLFVNPKLKILMEDINRENEEREAAELNATMKADTKELKRLRRAAKKKTAESGDIEEGNVDDSSSSDYESSSKSEDSNFEDMLELQVPSFLTTEDKKKRISWKEKDLQRFGRGSPQVSPPGKLSRDLSSTESSPRIPPKITSRSLSPNITSQLSMGRLSPESQAFSSTQKKQAGAKSPHHFKSIQYLDKDTTSAFRRVSKRIGMMFVVSGVSFCLWVFARSRGLRGKCIAQVGSACVWQRSTPKLYFADGMTSSAKCHFEKYKDLDILGCDLRNVDQDQVIKNILKLYTNIETLTMDRAGLNVLPEHVESSGRLRSISLRGNDIDRFPSGFLNMTASDNFFIDFAENPVATTFHMDGNGTTTLPRWFKAQSLSTSLFETLVVEGNLGTEVLQNLYERGLRAKTLRIKGNLGIHLRRDFVPRDLLCSSKEECESEEGYKVRNLEFINSFVSSTESNLRFWSISVENWGFETPPVGFLIEGGSARLLISERVEFSGHFEFRQDFMDEYDDVEVFPFYFGDLSSTSIHLGSYKFPIPGWFLERGYNETLKKVAVTLSPLSEVKDSDLANLRNIVQLNLAMNKLQSIDKNAFLSMTKLEKLFISNNVAITGERFDDFEFLENIPNPETVFLLDLSENR